MQQDNVSLRLTILRARQIDKGTYYVKIRFGKETKSTSRTKPTSKSTHWNEDLELEGKSTETIKINLLRIDSKGKEEVIARGTIKAANIKISEQNIRLKLKSKLFPSATLILNASKEEDIKLTKEETLNQFYDLIVDEKYELLKGICDTSNAMDMDELAFSLVALFLNNGTSLPMIKWAIKQEIKHSNEEELLFRGQTIHVKIISDYAAIIGKNYILTTLKPILLQMSRETDNKNITWEVNPPRAGKFLKKNRKLLIEYANRFLNTIISSSNDIPPTIKEVCRLLSTAVKSKFPGSVNTVLGGFLFLRFICPAIVTPEQCKLLETSPNFQLRRGLVLCAKLLQNLASGNTFGEKESFMEEFNPFITNNLKPMHNFFSTIRKKSGEPIPPVNKPLPKELREEHLIQVYYHVVEHKDKLSEMLSPELFSKLTEITDKISKIRLKEVNETNEAVIHRARSAFFDRFQSIFRY